MVTLVITGGTDGVGQPVVVEGGQVPPDTDAFDARDAARLHELTESLLSDRPW